MIRVGVAGWDYADWVGTVYPPGASRGFDRLAYLSRFVDVVEINSTFYRPAAPRAAESWARRTSRIPGFRFTAKAHRSWTHESEIPSRVAIRAQLDGIAPLRNAGVLATVLVQFPQSFHRAPESLDRLARLAEAAEAWPLVIEFRHASWDDDRAAAWMRGAGLGWCVVDQPRVGTSTAPPRPRVTSALAYLRLHGRNHADWFREGAGRDARYDYMYGAEELGALAETARSLAAQADATFVVQNNHFRGQALANALQMKRILQDVAPRAPAALVATYPVLEGAVVPDAPRLL